MKTTKTKKLEYSLYRYLRTRDEFLCPEVTIGFGSKNYGRVDFLSMDYKNEFRCYEVKVSVPDFRSKCKHTFEGEYNYFVMTRDMYDKVNKEIPDFVGVLVPDRDNLDSAWLSLTSIKRAKRQNRRLSDEIMKNSMIRSLAREAEKVWKQS